MFHRADDTLMGSRLDVTGVNEDNDDDNDCLHLPFLPQSLSVLLSHLR